MSDVPDAYQRKFMLKGFGPEKGKIKAAAKSGRSSDFNAMNLTQEP